MLKMCVERGGYEGAPLPEDLFEREAEDSAAAEEGCGLIKTNLEYNAKRSRYSSHATLAPSSTSGLSNSSTLCTSLSSRHPIPDLPLASASACAAAVRRSTP